MVMASRRNASVSSPNAIEFNLSSEARDSNAKRYSTATAIVIGFLVLMAIMRSMFQQLSDDSVESQYTKEIEARVTGGAERDVVELEHVEEEKKFNKDVVKQETTIKKEEVVRDIAESKPIVDKKPIRELFTIISDTQTGTIKRTVDVRLHEKVSESTLESIANEIHARSRKKYDRTFILYYLPGQAADAGAWASSHFNPTMKVFIMGMPVDADALVKDAIKENELELGQWEYYAPPGFIGILLRTTSGIIFRKILSDGRSVDEKVSVVSKAGDIILMPVEKNDTGDYWIIGAEGELRLMDELGFIGVAVALGERDAIAKLKAELDVILLRA